MISVKNHKNWLKQQAELNPSLVALKSVGKELSFSQYWNVSKRMAYFLAGKGVKKGNHIVLLSSNNFHFPLLINAIWILGATPIPINARLFQGEIDKQVSFVEASHFFYENEMAEQVSKIKFKNKFPIPDISQIEDIEFSCDVLHSEDDTAVIMFTSGTTSKSRAVQLSFKNLFFSAIALDKVININKSDSWLVSLPLYHVGGFSIITRSILTGSAIVFPNSLNVNDLADAIVNMKPTITSLVPTMLHRFLESNISPNEKLRCVFLGGSPARNKLIIDSIKKGWKIYSVYGSTETCSMVTALHPREQTLKTGSSGKPLGKNQIKIIPIKKGKKLKHNSGIISISGKSIMKGYFKESARSKNTNDTFISDDIGFIDNDGYLYVICRKDEIIISGGENINMKEVSKFISKHPKIKESYLFALPDKHWESILCAAIVAKNKEFSEYKLRADLKEKIASYKIPKKYFFLDELPKTELGKIDRVKLLGLLDL